MSQAAPVAEPPAKAQEGPQDAPGSVISPQGISDASPNWKTLYGGLQGLDDRVSSQLRQSFALLDHNSEDPKEARARAINQNFITRQLQGHLDPDLIRGNWEAVKSAWAKKKLGLDQKQISDTELYGQIAKSFAPETEEPAAQKDPWGLLKTALILTGRMAAHWHQTIGSVPLVNLPDAPVNELPNIPLPDPFPAGLTAKEMGYAWNILKPQIEGLETPESLGTMGAFGVLGKGAEMGSKVAAVALKGMSGVFTAVMAKAAKDGAENIAKVRADPNHTTMDVARAYASEAGNVFGALAGAVGILHGVSPKSVSAIKDAPIEEVPNILHEEAAKTKDPVEKAAIVNAAQEVQKVAAENETPPPEEPKTQPTVPSEEGKVEQPKAEPPAERPGLLVGIKNAVVDEEMSKMGLEPAEHGESLSWEQAKADADAKLAADPFAGQKLVQSLADKPRPITGQEDALLLSEVNRLKLERQDAEDALIQAKKAGDEDAQAEANIRIAKARDDFAKAEETATKVGTPQAQGLALRRMMMREDYSIASMEKQLAAETPDGKLTPEQMDQVRDLSKQIRDTGDAAAKHEARRLAAYKSRLKKLTEDYEERVKEGKLGPKPKAPPIKLDLEGELLKAAHERAKNEFKNAVFAERMKNRSFYEKGFNKLVKWRRGFLLSSPVTLGKLTAAAIWRMGSTAAEEGVGTALSKVPGISKVSEQAPRYGAVNVDAEAAAITQQFTQGMKDAWDLLKTGASNLDMLYGRGKDPAVAEGDRIDRSVLDFFGQIHGALKAPIKRAEFARSFQKRVAFAIRHGVDASNPLVQTRIAVEAYKDANRAIFLQDNTISEFFKRGSSALGPTGTAAMKLLLPIVKVPTNIVAESFEYATGLGTGSWRLAKALKAGTATLAPEQADLIMRNLQKGSLGAAALLLGYFNADKVGGYYQAGQKRKQGDVGIGNVKVFGHEIPSWAMHIPLMEVVQLGATVRRVAESKFRKKDKDVLGLGEGVWAGIMGLVDDVPYVREGSEVGKIAGGGPEGRYARGEFAKDVTVPQMLQFLARHFDKDSKGETIKRKPDTTLEHIETGIPGLRETVPAKKSRNVKYREPQP